MTPNDTVGEPEGRSPRHGVPRMSKELPTSHDDLSQHSEIVPCTEPPRLVRRPLSALGGAAFGVDALLSVRHFDFIADGRDLSSWRGKDAPRDR